MTTPILGTKLHIPRARSTLVPRPRLTARLDQGLYQEGSLALIAAPAGFGKTTLASEWVHGGGEAMSSRSVAWISLDEGDNDPARFFACLIAALRCIDKSAGQATESLLGSPRSTSADSLASTLAEDAAAITAPMLLVLDDYQYISNPCIHGALAFLLGHQPPLMHLLIATRVEPPLPLPCLRARGRLSEIRAEDLRFTGEETARFLGQALGPSLDAGQIASLEARTEGWIAGLQLAALSMRDRGDTDGFIQAFSGSNRHLVDYLADEVLDRQPEEMRDFLRRVCVLERFCAPLCDAVQEPDQTVGGTDGSAARPPGDSQAMLERLERQNLFIIALDDTREWYRFHHLFAGFLRAGLAPGMSAALHLRAAHWFEASVLLPEAVGHALEHAKATGDAREAARIITLAGSRALSEGALVTILGWLDALPDAVVRASGWLASFKAWSLLMTGQPETASSYVRSAEDTLGDDPSPVDRGRVISLRCAIAEPGEVLRMAPRALELLGDSDPLSRTGALFMLGDAQDAMGDVSGAEKTLQEAYQMGRMHGHRIMAAVALAHLAISINYQGRRREALSLCLQGTAQYSDMRGNPLPAAGLLHVVSGELAYEVNDLEAAHCHLQTGVKLGRQSTTALVVLYGLTELCRVLHAKGLGKEALAVIQEAQALASQSGDAHWLGAGTATEAFIRLRQGELSAARQWARDAGLRLTDPLDQTRKYEYLDYARVLLASGEAGKARVLLERLERAARADGRLRHLLTILILLALAEHAQGSEPKAFEHLEKALRLAAPEGYLRAFLDEGPGIARLIPSLRRHAPAFVDELLFAFGPPQPAPRTGDPSLVEPLSGRESEILRLMASGLSAPMIAERLFIAPSTVRTHIKRIHDKLGAHSRHEAVTRARALGLVKTGASGVQDRDGRAGH